MRRSILSLLGAAVLGLAGHAASAADLPVAYKAPPAPVAAPAPFNWTGFYAGLTVGGGWSNSRWFQAPVLSGPISGSGWLVGGTLGANWQAPGSSFVWGVEGDISWANISGATSVLCAPACTNVLNWFGTIRGRAGVATGAMLFYVTAGAAVGSFHPSLGVALTNYTDWGWTAGGGLEAAFGGNWSAKLEYLYADFGASPIFFAGPPPITATTYTLSVVRAGLNYRF